MEYDGDDPFDSLIPLCHVSSSQEERLRRCPFAPEPNNPQDDATPSSSPADYEGGGIRIASTPIMMVSLPESEDDGGGGGNSREDEFVTPPEEAAVSSSGEFRPAADYFGYDSGVECGAAVPAVDLSRDSDLGLSEVEAAQRENPDSHANRLNSEVQVSLGENTDLNRLNSEVEVPQSENLDSIQLNFEVEMVQGQNMASAADQSKSELEVSQKENLDSEANRLSSDIELTQRENLDFDANQLKSGVSETECKGIRVLTRELSLKAGLGESPLKKLKLSEQNSKEPIDVSEVPGATRTDIGFDFQEKAEINSNRSPTKRRLELSYETDDGRERISVGEFVEAMTSTHDDTVAAVEMRRLPSSILGRSENADEEEEEEEGGDEGPNEVTIFDVLNLLTEDCVDEAPSCSFLEICKGRGMTFPRPAWWPEHRGAAAAAGFEDDDMEVENFSRVLKGKGVVCE